MDPPYPNVPLHSRSALCTLPLPYTLPFPSKLGPCPRLLPLLPLSVRPQPCIPTVMPCWPLNKDDLR